MLGLAFGPQDFSDTNKLVSAQVEGLKQRMGGLDQREAPMRRGSRCGGI